MLRTWKTLSAVALVSIGVAAPVKVRVNSVVDGLPCRAGISVSGNNAGAQGLCWCEYEQYRTGCTSPDYKVVCAAEFAKSASVYPVEGDAWLLVRPER